MASQASELGWVVRFVPFSSAIDLPFWVSYCKEKLETIQLNEAPILIRPTYGVDSSRVQCQESSLQLSLASSVASEQVLMQGVLIGFNTLDSFQKVDKNELLHDFFMPKFASGSVDCLSSVLLLTFPDLKTHKILHWFAFPSIMARKEMSIRALHQERLTEVYSNLAANLEFMRRSLHADGFKGLPPYFIFTRHSCLPLSVESYAALKSDSVDQQDIVFGFFDIVGPVASLLPEQPMGWPMRNLVAFLSFHLELGGKTVRIYSYRAKGLGRIVADGASTRTVTDAADGILLTVVVPHISDYEFEAGGDEKSAYRTVGWELNARSKPGPRWVDLRPLLDPRHLAVQAADLNLKLMKWRMIPNLNVERLQTTKVLVVGAGTLGCSVARTLLGWGVRNFTFVDYGRVSYSNPVRQNLFCLDDCNADSGTGRPKAAAAAEALSTIAADAVAEGISLSIPMPGHAEPLESVKASVEALDKLVNEADAVFLLTDTRESRWLPTVMAAAHDKVLINAALGLDSWLVMRHGGGFSGALTRFGCYFCNDVVAPENSTLNRTLDQQCTVTRPGLAPIASSMAVEMFVALLHHPDGLNAAAPSSGTSSFSPTVAEDVNASPLGVIPHQVRGSLVSYTMMTPTVPAFKCCTACALPVVNAYSEDKVAFVFQTCQAADSAYLENISGLTTFRSEAADMLAQMEEEVDWGDEDESR